MSSAPGSKRNKLVPMAAHVGPNMTPMVDVVMVILIFFMLGSSFASRNWYLTNNTPAIKGGLSNIKTHAMPATRIDIRLQMRGTRAMVMIGVFQTEDIKGQLYRYLVKKKKLFGKKVKVILTPDNNVPYQDVITVYANCVKAQYHQVAFGYPRQ